MRTGAAAQLQPLADAVAVIRDGHTVALEGFTHLIPFAAGFEMIRQGRQELTLARMTPDLLYDQLVGAGCAARLVFSYAGNPGVGSLHRIRDAIEHGWPAPLSIEEHSHSGLAHAYAAGAASLPFTVLRGYAGTDLLERTPSITTVECPFTGERVAAVRALNPDVTIIHAQQADRHGNVMLWGLAGVQKEAVLAARHAIATVEELVEELSPLANAVVLPAWTLDAVALAPGGAWPSYAAGYYPRDNVFYERWDEISRERDSFTNWLREHLLTGRDSAPAGGPA